MRSSYKKIFFVLFLGFVVFAFIGYRELTVPNLADSSTVVTFEIKSGASVISISEKLVRSGLINNASWFRIYTKVTGKDKNIKSGTYKIKGGMNLMQIADYITANNQEVFFHPNKISIPEGLTLEQIEDKFISAGLATKKEIEQVFYDKEFIYEHTGLNAKSLEGFIYPKTYYYEDEIDLKDFLIQYPLKEFMKEYANYINDESFYKNLILASIVEKESGTKDEKPIVASVFKNRMKNRMTLSSCATHNKIFYQRGQKPPKILLNKHLEIMSPYNTYKNQGLPPTPICSPAKDSYEAVIANVNTDYLYFFADFKGKNIFSTSYKEHNRKKKSSWNSSHLR